MYPGHVYFPTQHGYVWGRCRASDEAPSGGGSRRIDRAHSGRGFTLTSSGFVCTSSGYLPPERAWPFGETKAHSQRLGRSAPGSKYSIDAGGENAGSSAKHRRTGSTPFESQNLFAQSGRLTDGRRDYPFLSHSGSESQPGNRSHPRINCSAGLCSRTCDAGYRLVPKRLSRIHPLSATVKTSCPAGTQAIPRR